MRISLAGFCTLIAVLLSAVAFRHYVHIGYEFAPGDLDAAIERYSRAGRFVPPDFGLGDPDDYMRHIRIAASQASGKKLEAVQFNGPIDDQMINVYIFKSDPEGLFLAAHNNCAYTGHRNIILIDLGYLHQLTARLIWPVDQNGHSTYGDVSDDAVARLNAMPKTALYWIVGHEVGHLAFGHGGKHFNEPEFKRNASDTIPIAEEVAADRFSIQDPESCEYLYMGLTTLIGFEISKLEKSQGPFQPYGGTNVLYVHRESQFSGHPPLLIRALDTIILLGNTMRQKDIGQGITNLYAEIRNRILIVE